MVPESHRSSAYVPIEVVISTEYATKVTISSPYPGVSRTLQLTPPGTTITLPSGVALNDTGVQQKGIMIESARNISVYVFHEDGFLVLPSQYLQTNYHLTTTDHGETLLAIAPVEGDAKVRIGSTKTVYIPALSVYYMKSTMPIRGVAISSNVSVAVIAGHYKSFQSNRQTQIEFIIPSDYWGMQFIIPPLEFAKKKYDFFYPKSDQSTPYTAVRNFQVDKGTVLGDYRYIPSADYKSNYVEARDPIGVIEWYYAGLLNSFMMTIPAMSQYSNNYRFATPTYQGQHFIAAIVRDNESDGLRLDGSKIAMSRNTQTVSTLTAERFFVITVKITSGWHTVRHVDPDVMFGLLMYGGNEITAYGLPLGIRFD